MDKLDKIYVAGHRGLVGSALVRALERHGYRNLVVRTRRELDLRDQHATRKFFQQERPDHVMLAAAKVGGIFANNTERADFIYENLIVQCNVIHTAFETGVKRLLFLGSSCIYPRAAPQPMREEYLLAGPLEPTNEPYAIAKIAGIKMCESYNRQHGTKYVSVMPTNLYGPNDNFDLECSHVLPALIRKFCDAKLSGAPSVTVWGTGQVRREFLYVDDLAEACILVVERYDECLPINIGYGDDMTIKDLVDTISRESGYDGHVEWNADRPDGVPRKLLCSDRIRALGWRPWVELQEGIRKTVLWYYENRDQIRCDERT